ncbi:MAG: tetratricopeptide repeat protein [Candidatus Pacebacteria bacterium]|jgi:hypothetical protein|nr:tetratricopeptide repeat protein [Candidatus Paceibacterota bacterium]
MDGWFGKIIGKFKSDGFVVAVLVIAGFFVYANALLNDFVWDDEEQVVNNTVIRDWRNFPLIFTSSTFYAGGAGLSGGFYRPLVTLSYFINYSVWGLQPFGYHLLQLLFHCANAALVFYLLKSILEKYGAVNGRAVAIAAALIFAVHPANVESVAYVGSIGEVTYTFLMLAGLFLLVRSLDASGAITNQKNFFAAFAVVFLGLLAKETAMIAFLLMFVYLLLFGKRNWGIYLKFLTGTALAAGFYLYLRIAVAKIAAVPDHYAPIYYAPLWQRLLTVPQEVFQYLKTIFWPDVLSISRHFVVVSPPDPAFWQPFLVLLALAVVIVFYIYKTRSKLFVFFVLWFGVTLAPVLNIIPLDMTMAERWLYAPIIGALAAVIFAVSGPFSRIDLGKQKIALVLFAGVVIALGARTVSRNFDWRNGLSLYGHDIAQAGYVSPQGTFDLENNFGVELFRSGGAAAAGEHFKRSIELQPKWASSQNNLGAVLQRQGDLEGALKQYRIAADMNYYLAHENIAGILMQMKKYDEAKKFLEESLVKFPQNSKLQLDLALLYAADNIGNDKDAKQKAIYLLSLVLRADPQNGMAQQLYLMLQNGQKIEL